MFGLWCGGVFFTIVLAEQGVGTCEDFDVCAGLSIVIDWLYGLDLLYDPFDGMAGMAQALVEVVAVVKEPLLQYFEQIPWEVTLIQQRVPVLLYVVQALHEHGGVLRGMHDQTAVAQPLCRPCEGVEQQLVIAVVKALIVMWIKVYADVLKDRIQVVIGIMCWRVAGCPVHGASGVE